MTPPRVNKKAGTPPARRDLAARFLSELSRTLDIRGAIKKLEITEDEARIILGGAARSLVDDASRGKVDAPAPAAGAPEDQPLLADLDAGLLEEPAPRVIHIHVDGASRGNPGQAGAGAVITTPGGKIIKRLTRYLGVKTNNVAEYEALVMALEAAARTGAEEVKVFADSELMVKQIRGEYRVKSPDLKPYYEKATKLLKSLKGRWSIAHVYRENNSEADRLANLAIDKKA